LEGLNVVEPSVELVFVYCGEHTFLRLCLASIKKFYAGIDIQKITVLTGNIDKKHLDYLNSRDDICVVSYTDISGSEPYNSDIYYRYIIEHAKADFIIYMHLDAIPISANWAVPVYSKCKESYLGVYVVDWARVCASNPEYNREQGMIDVWSPIMCFSRDYFSTHKFPLLLERALKESLFPEKLFGYTIGTFAAGTYWYDSFTVAMGRVMEMGFNPVVDVFNSSFITGSIKHFGPVGAYYGHGKEWCHKEHNMEKHTYNIKQLFFAPEYKKQFGFLDLIKNDKYPTYMCDEILDVFLDTMEV